MKKKRKIRAGEWVEVLGKEEILGTLDKKGMFDHLPFMPEMFQYCGQRFRVFKRAHKTCYPPSGLGGRRMERAVHLEDVRCDGQAHGGCQAGCLVFWKETWLKRLPVNRKSEAEPLVIRPGICLLNDGNETCKESDIWAGIYPLGEETSCELPTFVCQATQLANATEPLRWWDPRQYIEAYTSGNARLLDLPSAFLFFLYSHIAGAGLGLGAGLRWIYDMFQKLCGGTPYPSRAGKVPRGKATPSEKLDLQPGEWIRVKSYADILETLDENMCNRGMFFDVEMVPFTEKSFRVLKRVEKIIDEKTGRMITLKSDAVILENVACQARYSKCRKFCSRSIYSYWREIWLERAYRADQE
jgi:hypothetical protein